MKRRDKLQARCQRKHTYPPPPPPPDKNMFMECPMCPNVAHELAKVVEAGEGGGVCVWTGARVCMPASASTLPSRPVYV